MVVAVQVPTRFMKGAIAMQVLTSVNSSVIMMPTAKAMLARGPNCAKWQQLRNVHLKTAKNIASVTQTLWIQTPNVALD